MKLILPSLIVLSLLVVGRSTDAQGQVWVVDDDGGAGVDFTNVQDAVDAASAGDAVLVRAGDYEGNVDIDGKWVVLVGDPGARLIGMGGGPLSVPGGGTVRVRNLNVAKRALVLGFEVSRDEDAGFLDGQPGGLSVENCDGVVWAEGLATTTMYTARAIDSNQVVLVSSTGDATDLEFFAGSNYSQIGALLLEDATAAVYDCDVLAVDGLGGCIAGVTCGQRRGGPGAFLEDASHLFASGSVLRGGIGQPGLTNEQCKTGAGGGGDGGHGIDAEVSSTSTLVDTQLTPGTGGVGDCSVGTTGSPTAGAGSSQTLAGNARSLTSTTPVREGETTTITFRGDEGDFVIGLASTSPLLLDVPGFQGPLAANAPWVVQPVGFLPASGEVSLGLTVGALPGGVDFFVRYLQAIHVTPALEYHLSAPTALVVLDDAF